MQFFGGSEISPSPPAPTASGNNAHMMYVFNRNGVCLLYREWNRPLHTLNAQQDHKLMFGLLFSLKSLTAKMDPTKYIYFYIYFIFSFLRIFDLNGLLCILHCIVQSLVRIGRNLLVAKGDWEKRIILALIYLVFGGGGCVGGEGIRGHKKGHQNVM